MQTTFKKNYSSKPASGAAPAAATQGRAGFQARTSASGEAKKVTGEVLFRVKRKGVEGELNQDGNQIKWVTVGSLYKNTNTETGEVFYSLSVKEAITPGLHKAFDNTPPGTQAPAAN